MTNKKENLIKALHGSLTPIKDVVALIDNEEIYDETGHVDIDFLTCILEWMSENASIATKVQKSLNRLLGIPDELQEKNSKDDSGKKWNVEDILKHCTLNENILYLPNVQFNKKSYAEAKKWIEEAGGKWEGGKTQGFKFEFDANRVFSILHEGKRCNLQQEFQFFETPAEVADWLVMLAGGIDKKDTVLEPSAGRGAIIKAVQRCCPAVKVDAYELMPENKELLLKIGVNVIGDDFTKGCNKEYSKIIANPPFTGNQDIDHVRIMYDHLLPGGTLAAIMSPHWVIGQEKKCAEFRDWLNDVGGKQYSIDKGEFKESGTSISTTAVVIKK